MQKKTVNQPNSVLLLNNGKGDFELMPLPLEAQLSPIFGIVVIDHDHDGLLDILLTGNFFDVLPEIGRYDGNNGLILKGLGKDTNGKPQFVALASNQTGFEVKGQVRNMKKAKSINGKTLILLAKNKDKLQVFE
ncbi:MAG: VCBS repeat-containing protein [Spirosomataceae bacterium]